MSVKELHRKRLETLRRLAYLNFGRKVVREKATGIFRPHHKAFLPWNRVEYIAFRKLSKL